MQRITQTNRWLLALSLAAVLGSGAVACGHRQFHRDLRATHDDFHSEPHTRAEHRRFHEDLADYHRDMHDRSYFDGRAYGRDSYYGHGYYRGGY